MEATILFALVYASLVFFAFHSGGQWSKSRKYILGTFWISLCVTVIQVVLLLGFDRTFRGVWADRFAPFLFLISGIALFALYRRRLPSLTKWIAGCMFFYPMVAAFTLLMDRMFFAIVAAPIFVVLDVPTIQYSDSRFDVRTMTGLIAPAWLELVEKNGILEHRWGVGEGIHAQGVQPDEGLILLDSDSAKVFRFAINDSSFVWTFNPQ
ncbi:MAG: hypothetical protein IPN62_19465 [Flavobacteriales bacterium]|nr:hypothetical protein [Flavobacteriales bacterium]